MLQRRKTKEPSSLTLVPYAESGSAVAPALGQNEGRGPLPEVVAPTAQTPAPPERSGRANVLAVGHKN